MTVVPDWLIIVIVVLVVLIVLLAIGGWFAVQRRQREEDASWQTAVEEANRHLAEAHAADKGWEPAALREAARTLFDEQQPGAGIKAMELVAVEDRPGIEEDRAVFRIEDGTERVHHLTVGRTPDGWALEALD
jgi:hypothetical protein